ncbi:MAG: DUF177 domain-containing protein [Litorilinea sp.]
MQFNVAQLLKEPIGANRRYEMQEDLRDLDSELDVLGPLVGHVQLIRIHSGILVKGELSTAIRANCNRCLEPLAEPVRFELEESFRPLTEVRTGRFILPDEFEGEEDALEDEALLINEQHILDISEVVRQNIWLAMPMIAGCNWTGEGECPNWLNYLEQVRETTGEPPARGEGREDAIDPRWAALEELRKQMEGKDSSAPGASGTDTAD